MQHTWEGESYFQTMDIPLPAGRYLIRADTTDKNLHLRATFRTLGSSDAPPPYNFSDDPIEV